ncbi:MULTISPECIES: hypothetical protein [unclassified Gordonia (in: high G+C Gram-positive bacteria)]|uniref:hypothetical protein n=1 Tax=unclassified Gordonia (in: high G+C Gram-positive bacteria) TaxID=2657482 RepID=UPI0025BC9F0A|nr:hypothetical protein [Gordonia sp. UBA7599]
MILDRSDNTRPATIDGRKLTETATDILWQTLGLLAPATEEMHDVPEGALTITVRAPGLKSLTLTPHQIRDVWEWISSWDMTGHTDPLEPDPLPTSVGELDRLLVLVDATYMPVSDYAALLDIPLERAAADVRAAAAKGLTSVESTAREGLWVEARSALYRLQHAEWPQPRVPRTD